MLTVAFPREVREPLLFEKFLSWHCHPLSYQHLSNITCSQNKAMENKQNPQPVIIFKYIFHWIIVKLLMLFCSSSIE